MHSVDGRRDGPTVRYLRSREAVLGQRFELNRDPEIAANLLAEVLGGRALALAWAVALADALADGRGAA